MAPLLYPMKRISYEVTWIGELPLVTTAIMTRLWIVTDYDGVSCYDRSVSKTHTRPAWRGWGLDQIRSLPAS